MQNKIFAFINKKFKGLIEINCSRIMAILIDKRSAAAPQVQEILTDHGCIIGTRLGLHEVNGCSENGLILLTLCGDSTQIAQLEENLTALHRVQVKQMEIGFED